MLNMTVIRGLSNNPELEFQQHIARDSQNKRTRSLLCCQFELLCDWLENDVRIALWAFYRTGPCGTEVLVIEDCDDVQERLNQKSTELETTDLETIDLETIDLEAIDLEKMSRQFRRPIIRLDQPIALSTVDIEKPWGREIWYTGIEKRGVSTVTDGQYELPLPWLQAVASDTVFKTDKRIVLLKILDPLPEPVYGDLYFELHEKKQEVYIVTHIDKTAWPDDVGAIRLGFDQAKLAQYEDEASFLVDYRLAVDNYNVVRRHIDALLDERRKAQSIPLDEPIPAVQLQDWLAELPGDLNEKEQHLRNKMEAFTALQALRLGDVVAIPCYVPHALQHGVRTVEFQTPVYERKILSFAQKVLTQDAWDTEQALQQVQVRSVNTEMPNTQIDRPGLRIQTIVAFDDFQVLRVELGEGEAYRPDQLSCYRLLLVVSGEIELAGKVYFSEQACLIPNNYALQVSAKTEQAIFLVATPVQ